MRNSPLNAANNKAGRCTWVYAPYVGIQYCNVVYIYNDENDNIEWKVALAGKEKKNPIPVEFRRQTKDVLPRRSHTAYNTCNQVYIIILYRKFLACLQGRGVGGGGVERSDKGKKHLGPATIL